MNTSSQVSTWRSSKRSGTNPSWKASIGLLNLLFGRSCALLNLNTFYWKTRETPSLLTTYWRLKLSGLAAVLDDQHCEVGNTSMLGPTNQIVNLSFRVQNSIVKIWAMEAETKEIHVDIHGRRQWNQIARIKMPKLSRPSSTLVPGHTTHALYEVYTGGQFVDMISVCYVFPCYFKADRDPAVNDQEQTQFLEDSSLLQLSDISYRFSFLQALWHLLPYWTVPTSPISYAIR